MSDPNVSRSEMAAKIQLKPSQYKVCEGCGSIVARKASVCPNCNAYRFDTQVQKILQQVELLATREPMSIDKKDYI